VRYHGSRLRMLIIAISCVISVRSRPVLGQGNPHLKEPASEQGIVGSARVVDASGSAEMSVYADTNAVTVFTPTAGASVESKTDAWSVSGHYLADIVSAASIDIVSTASPRWTEVRHEAALSAAYKPGPVGLRLSASVSREPDYLSISAGGLLLLELANKNVNPTFGYSITSDTAGRTGTPFAVFSQRLLVQSLTAATEFIVDRRTTALLEANGVLELGDSSKPYRFLPLFAPEVVPLIQPGASLAFVNEVRLPGRITERVPEQRVRFALSARFAHRFNTTTLTLFERVYADTWGLFASTSEARYLWDVNERFVFWLSTRAHLQNSVFFWERAYAAHLASGAVVVPTYRTGDRELSSLISGSVGAGVRWNVGPRGNPQVTRLTLQADEMATQFRDALYIDGRLAHLVILQAESEF